MTRVKNRRVAAVGGWQYHQPQTGWSLERNAPNAVWDFGAAVQAIIQHRKGNPRFNLSTDQATVENELDEHNALRMLSMPGAESYVDTTQATDPKHRPPLNPSSPNVVAASERVIGGAKIALEMFGQKGPVSRDLAEKRAAVCVDCPANDKGDWTRWFTVPAAGIVRQMLSVVTGMKLKTSFDDRLVFCTACSCPLKSKVWAPLDHIKSHTPQEAIDHLDPRCWILKNDN